MIDNTRSRAWCFAVGPRLDRGVRRRSGERYEVRAVRPEQKVDGNGTSPTGCSFSYTLSTTAVDSSFSALRTPLGPQSHGCDQRSAREREPSSGLSLEFDLATSFSRIWPGDGESASTIANWPLGIEWGVGGCCFTCSAMACSRVGCGRAIGLKDPGSLAADEPVELGASINH